MKDAPPKSGHRQQDLGSVLRNSSLTMRELGGVVGQLETHLLQDIARIKANHASLAALQSLDLLSQTLGEMGAMLDRLANSVPTPLAIDATAVIDPIKLEHLRHLIADQTAPLPQPPAERADTKDIAMF